MQDVIVRNLDHPWNVGESCAQMWPILHLVSECLPDSKFIWLRRNFADVVASYYHTRQAWTPGSKLGIYKEHLLYKYVNGVEVQAMTRSQWIEKSRFEKTCWFIDYVSKSIGGVILHIGGKSQTVNIENLDLNKVFKFLNVASKDSLPVIPKLDVSNPKKLTDKELKWIEKNIKRIYGLPYSSKFSCQHHWHRLLSNYGRRG
jgi:hypothetical protein